LMQEQADFQMCFFLIPFILLVAPPKKDLSRLCRLP
jgi:hypothetical protein